MQVFESEEERGYQKKNLTRTERTHNLQIEKPLSLNSNQNLLAMRHKSVFKNDSFVLPRVSEIIYCVPK